MRAKDVVSVYARSVIGRRGALYTANVQGADGVEASAAGCSRSEAVREAKADMAYIRSAGRLAAHGHTLYPQGRNSWCFQFPHGGSMCFAATTLEVAFSVVANNYPDHPTASLFVAALQPHVRAVETEAV